MQIIHHKMIEAKNVDDVFFRNATIAVMHYLNENLYIEQIEKEVVKKYHIPIFYNKAQDTQFMRDYFTQYGDNCNEIEYADGDYDIEPLGIVTLDSISINTSKMTSKFVRGIDKKTFIDENGYKVKKAYSAKLFTLPIDMKFSLELRSDDNIQTFRIIQGLLDTIYKNGVIHFPYRELRIRSNVALDNSAQIDKKIQLNWNETQYQTIKTNLALETYYPVFDDSTAIFRGNVIMNFRRFLNGMEEDIVPKEDADLID